MNGGAPAHWLDRVGEHVGIGDEYIAELDPEGARAVHGDELVVADQPQAFRRAGNDRHDETARLVLDLEDGERAHELPV